MSFIAAMIAYGYTSLRCEVVGDKVYLICTMGDEVHRWEVVGNGHDSTCVVVQL